MPIVKIELPKGQGKDFLCEVMKVIMDVVVEVLQLPDDDRNIRLFEYDKDLFQMKAPYKYIIQIDMFVGRKVETKKKLYKQITEVVQGNFGIPGKELFILINEHPRENWGLRGGIAASDVKLDYSVEV